jgi:hypothetical protein
MIANGTTYLATLVATIVVAVGAAFLLNAVVDPLWYFGGNKITPVNFAFNERISKPNLIAGHEGNYDCVIFGDSRVTLLPEYRIAGHHCFNFAFSSGAPLQFVDYAEWLKARGFSPKLVIVGLSAGDFRSLPPSHNVPDFIKEKAAPESPFLAYLSLDVLRMSQQTLFGTSPLDRIYDRDFHCRGAFVSRHYDPRVPIRDLHTGPFDNRAPIAVYEKLKSIFPQAQFVGYASPLSAWAIAEYERIGWLPSYTKALHDAAQVFDRFTDYSIPSAMTTDPAMTYDGTHYTEVANEKIAATLLSGGATEALDLKAMTEQEVIAAYQAQLRQYADKLKSAVQ